MLKIFLAIICIIIKPLLLTAQEELGRKWAISLIPSYIQLPEDFAGIQPGVEVRLSNRYRLLTELTFPMPQKNPDASALNRKFFRIKPELRYLFRLRPGKTRNYIGLQMTYSFRSFTDASGNGHYYEKFPSDSVYYFSSAHIKSPIASISFQTGTLFYDRRRISVDVFVGMGSKFINTKFSEIVNLIYTKKRYNWNVVPSYRRNGNTVFLHFNGGFKIFYHFNIPKKHSIE